jgi:hypothetical protein
MLQVLTYFSRLNIEEKKKENYNSIARDIMDFLVTVTIFVT